VILPVLAKDTFRGTAGTYGLLTTMLSIGAVVGSLAVGLINHPKRQYLLFAALGFGVALAATAAAPGVAVACVTLAIMGAAAFCFVTLCSTILQLHSSSAYRGRVMALWVFVYLGTTPIGSILTGWIISAGGPRVALLVGSGGVPGCGGPGRLRPYAAPSRPGTYRSRPVTIGCRRLQLWADAEGATPLLPRSRGVGRMDVGRSQRKW
jgi:MFS family permease